MLLPLEMDCQLEEQNKKFEIDSQKEIRLELDRIELEMEALKENVRKSNDVNRILKLQESPAYQDLKVEFDRCTEDLEESEATIEEFNKAEAEYIIKLRKVFDEVLGIKKKESLSQSEINDITPMVIETIDKFYHYKQEEFYQDCKTEADKKHRFRQLMLMCLDSNEENRHGNKKFNPVHYDKEKGQMFIVAFRSYKRGATSVLLDLLGSPNSNELGLGLSVFSESEIERIKEHLNLR